MVTTGPDDGANGWNYIAIVFETGHDNNLLESGEKYKVVVDFDWSY